MSKRHKLAGLIRRINRLKARIEADQNELKSLELRRGCMLSECIVDEQPPGTPNWLILSGMARNPVARNPVVQNEH